MAFILYIDTALDKATVSLSKDGELIQLAGNNDQKDHAAWLQPAIQQIMQDAALPIDQLNAIAVNIGPGSYTGLRVGLSTAKGLCYALKIPLIAISSLESIARSASEEIADLICPMIDARRMEVFTAVYDKHMAEVIKPQSFILDKDSFHNLLKGHKILFLGNGSVKFQNICTDPNAVFKYFPLNFAIISRFIYQNFVGNNFVDLAYTEPLYLKEFYSNSK